MEANTETELKHIPLQHLHEALGGKMVPFAGFLMPVRYTSDMDEHHTVRQRAGIFDVSHMGEFWVEGPEAFDFVQNLVTNDVSKLAEGQAQYNVMCYENGTAVDDLLVYKWSNSEYLLVVNAGNLEKDWEWVNRQNKYNCTLSDVSEKMCLFAVQGPLAQQILQKLTETDLSAIPYYHFAKGNIAGKFAILSNTGYTGAGGFEVYTHSHEAEYVWNAIMEAGKPDGLQPIGLGARDTLRLEMGFALYGHELDDQTTPLEANLGWVTKLSKTNFVGKEALLAQKAAGIKKKLGAFLVEGKGGIPRAGYSLVTESGQKAGTVTSGTQSPSVGIGFGMAFFDTAIDQAQPLFLKVRERLFPIIITKLPLEGVKG